MKNNSVFFKDSEFMTADEKGKVWGEWRKFIDALAFHYKEPIKFRGQLMYMPEKYFTKRLYNHLHLRCSFIAHYSHMGFYSTFFKMPGDTIGFIEHFDKEKGAKESPYWVRGEYSDINEAMVETVEWYKKTIYESMQAMHREKMLAVAKAMVEQYGYTVTKKEEGL